MKKGFTLIELLAVIVILAIIALIATPIVLNIINNSKESASIRSAELYVKAVEYAIANKILEEGSIENNQYPIMSNGNICLGSYVREAKTCNGKDINDKENESVLRVEVSGEYPKEGYIVIENGQIVKELSKEKEKKTELIISGQTIVKNDNNEFVLEEKEDTPTGPTLASCELKSGAAKTIGAKYECDFGDGKRKFYILELGNNPVTGTTLASDEVALILEGNYDTTTQAWCASGDDNSCNADGLTSKLNDIAEAWTKLEREQIVLPSALQIIVANNPSKNTVEFTSGIQSWLYNWPDNANYGDSAPYGYWTSTPYAGGSLSAWGVDYYGYVEYDYSVGYGSSCGVRPVVNLKL